MAAITSTGVGSGLDVNTIVTSLMSVEQRPLTLLQQQAGTLQARLSAFGTLKGQLASLGDVAARLASPDNWNPLRVDSSNAAAADATAGTKASAGKHTLEVSQLARAQVLASGAYASSTSVVGTGTLTLELGTTAGGAFTPRTGGSPAAIAITAANQTLAGVRDAINAAQAGVTASIVTGSGGAQLVLRGPEGAAGSVRLSVADADGANIDGSGLSALAWDPAAAAGAGRNLTQTQAAQDAKFRLDGLDLSAATNTPADVLEGVTLNLKQVTTAPVDLGIAVDTAGVRKNVNDFVTAYNALNKLLQAQTRADPGGTNRGALQADSTAVSLLNGLRGMLHGTVAGLGGAASLAAAGIELQRDGSLSLVESRVAPLLQQPAQLSALFAQSGTGDARGFGLRFKQWAQALTGEAGPLASRADGLQRGVDANRKRQDAEQARLDRTEQRLRAQYQRLDSEMTTLKARMQQMSASLGLTTG
ncbi:flagellar filament capping protein FliD [Ramlibacter alkalitolerans]|uniref:Flagellar hook-associated protein 2 n=1 Tax=Ramlibacter alkalitolerans TaxID=2039631 RepID=A0ABS1JKX4_9BURK|nr:flagellar filament capping protein FliD [Ramlibacter alkalitolerans]MBL0424879.1 flagellar filament capping protein FliD [Ramlibacter alkalitolerans]